ncbi:hypothetical protein DL96DRAFT_1578971 [Flagelloscypha sp. PMI_526]|nr:hypothetical protein DL96DRAFT_1578971 [Flagelloscypha sp. PMI_526]
MSCRHRKIRCDGALPICGQCQLIPGGHEDCEYRDECGGKTNIELLEENIARLEQRIQELETMDDPPPEDAVLLSMPYNQTSQTSLRTSPTEPSPGDRINCLRTFVDNCSHLCFFLHLGKFKDDAIRATQGHNTLCPAMLDVACLWGARMAPHIATGINSAPSLLYCIQVELLLSLYYIDTGKSLRAAYHANAAVSWANGANLPFQGSLALPQDSLEQFESIQAFWMCLIVSNHFVSQGPTPFNYPSNTLTNITTPWPIIYSDTLVVPNNERVVQTYFISQIDSSSTTPKAVLAKSSILYEWATNLNRNGAVGAHVLDTLIPQLAASFPLADVVANEPDLVLAQAFIQVAIIRRYSGSKNPAHQGRCFNASFVIADTVRVAVRQGQWKIVNPMIWVSPLLISNGFLFSFVHHVHGSFENPPCDVWSFWHSCWT